MIRLPRISNFTDIDPFFDEPEVGVRLIGHVNELGTPDLLILPGTKSTMDDLAWLKHRASIKPSHIYVNAVLKLLAFVAVSKCLVKHYLIQKQWRGMVNLQMVLGYCRWKPFCRQ